MAQDGWNFVQAPSSMDELRGKILELKTTTTSYLSTTMSKLNS